MNSKTSGKRAFALVLAFLLFAAALSSAACRTSEPARTEPGGYFGEDHGDDYGDYDDTLCTPGPAEELDFTVVDLGEPLEVDTYDDFTLGSKRYLSIYDADYYGLFFDQPSVSVEQCINDIDANPAIGEQYKNLLRSFVISLAEKYPDADLRPFDLNLKTLKVVECEPFDLALHAVSIDAYGCYVQAENTIYVPIDYEYRPGTWEYQVIMHEFGHAARTVNYEDEQTSLSINLGAGSCVIPEEALNSVFTVSLFDYEERDIAYQLQSNMFLVMLDCMDNYSLSDYINHSLSYFAHKLDEQNGNTNYAMGILRLIEEQRSDWANDDYEREQAVYYPIYHYLTKMYLDKYAEPGMSAEELRAVVDGLLEIVMFDVPEDYHIDTEEFYRYAEEYYQG